MSDKKGCKNRQKFIEDNSHLWGKVDPIDGIPYRPPVEIIPERRRKPKTETSIYEEDTRSGPCVKIRIDGVLHHVGTFATKKEAKAARDKYRAEHPSLRRRCEFCGLKFRLATPTDTPPICCMFAVIVDDSEGNGVDDSEDFEFEFDDGDMGASGQPEQAEMPDAIPQFS